jgi:hypothetical protein
MTPLALNQITHFLAPGVLRVYPSSTVESRVKKNESQTEKETTCRIVRTVGTDGDVLGSVGGTINIAISRRISLLKVGEESWPVHHPANKNRRQKLHQFALCVEAVMTTAAQTCRGTNRVLRDMNMAR